MAVACGILALCTVTSAHASVPYPDELRALLELSYAPSCSLCHGSGADAGSVSTLFGQSMVARGLSATTYTEFDGGLAIDGGTFDASLVAALNAMRADGVDSDGDGAQDLDELTWGGDPNQYDGLKPNPNQSVNYGCSISRVPLSNGNVGWFIAGLSLLTIRRIFGQRRTPKSLCDK